MTREVYEVWSIESGSVLSAFPTEHEALDLVRLNFARYGMDSVRRLMIVREQRGRSEVLWEGAALLQRLAPVPASRDEP